jgi:hypothetical protein
MGSDGQGGWGFRRFQHLGAASLAGPSNIMRFKHDYTVIND